MRQLILFLLLCGGVQTFKVQINAGKSHKTLVVSVCGAGAGVFAPLRAAFTSDTAGRAAKEKEKKLQLARLS